jgi:hypothetical protein
MSTAPKYEVVELFFRRPTEDDPADTELRSNTWTTDDANDFNHLAWFENADEGEDCYFREDDDLITIYRYVD